MKQRLRTLAFLCLASGSLAGCSLFGSSPPEAASPPEPSAGAEDTARQSAGDGDEPRPYDRVITDEAESDEGLFITHRIGDRLYFEIPDSILGREMLLLGRTVEHSARTGFVSGGARMIVLWERRGEHIVLRETLHEATADSTRAIWRQVSRMQRGPIVGAFDIEAFGADSAAVVEVTPLYTRPNEQMGSISELNRDRSWIESASSFPRNVEVEATQTGRIRGGSGG